MGITSNMCTNCILGGTVYYLTYEDKNIYKLCIKMTSYLTENTVCLHYQEQSLNCLYEKNTENVNTLCRLNIYFFLSNLDQFFRATCTSWNIFVKEAARSIEASGKKITNQHGVNVEEVLNFNMPARLLQVT